MKKCPECKLINPDCALTCDCGYNFEDKIPDKVDLSTKPSIRIVDITGKTAWNAVELLGQILPRKKNNQD